MRIVVSAITLPRTGTYGKRARMQGQQARQSNSPASRGGRRPRRRPGCRRAPGPPGTV